MQSIHRALSTFIFVSCGVFLLQACSVLQPETYVPKRGQMGKDVMWLPTSDDLVFKMLDAAQVGPQDELVDLGAGDGKIPIAAATQFGARAWGIEYNKDLAALAQRNAQRAGVAERVRIVHGDIFKEDFSKATVVTMYLLEELNAQLRPTILAMKPGTRVLSNTFSMGDWEPDQVIRVTQNLLGARMQGAELHFSFINADGQLKAVKVFVNGQVLSGEVTGPYGMVEMQPATVKVEGRRS
jgi:hypothetical protein